jgi:hypothetical protein
MCRGYALTTFPLEADQAVCFVEACWVWHVTAGYTLLGIFDGFGIPIEPLSQSRIFRSDKKVWKGSAVEKIHMVLDDCDTRARCKPCLPAPLVMRSREPALANLRWRHWKRPRSEDRSHCVRRYRLLVLRDRTACR